MGQKFMQNLRREGPGLLGTAAAGLLPISRPLLGPLARIGAGGATAGAARLAESGSLEAAGTEAATFGLGQAAGEAVFLPAHILVRQRTAAKVLDQAERAYSGAIKAWEQQKATEKLGVATANQAAKAAYATRVTEAKQAFETAQNAHAETAAAQIAAAWKKLVPAWRSQPENTKGLLDMVYGKGQQQLSADFDKALQAVIQAGAGKPVRLSLEDASALKLSADIVASGSGGPPSVRVDGGALSKAAIGVWQKDPALYRRVFESLDEAGLGNEAARGAYRAGQALITFLDKMKALDGEVLHPDRVLAGLTQLKSLNLIRKRGMGDIFTGPLQAATRPGLPTAPPEIPKPILKGLPVPPPKPTMAETGLKPVPISASARFHIGAALAQLPAALIGQHGYGAPYLAGGLAGLALLPKQMISGPVKLGPLGRAAFRASPSAAGEVLRIKARSTE